MIPLSFLLYFLRPLGPYLCVGRLVGVGLGCCVHMLQLWFCSHLSVISKEQPVGRNRVRDTVALDLPFSVDIEG